MYTGEGRDKTFLDMLLNPDKGTDLKSGNIKDLRLFKPVNKGLENSQTTTFFRRVLRIKTIFMFYRPCYGLYISLDLYIRW